MRPAQLTQPAPRLGFEVWDLGFGVLTLLFYTFTLSPNLLPADAGEYQVTGALLGVAHPPGFALYTIFSWLTTKILFWLQPATAINFLSALFAALTLTLVSHTVHRLTHSRLAGIAAALALGFSTTFWAQATTANVRMLTALATALALASITNYQLRLASRPTPDAGLEFGIWDLGFISFSLGLAVSHHGSLIFIAALLGLYTLWLNPLILRRPWPLLAGLIPFLAWLYFPLRSGAFGAPAHIATLNGFLEHILARGFRGDIFFFATPTLFPSRLLVFGNLLTFQFTWPVVLLSALGGLLALWRNRATGLLLLSLFTVHSFVSITYHSPQTVEYLLPSYVFMALALGYALAEASRLISHLLARLPAHPLTRPLTPVLPGLLALILLIPQFTATFPSYLILARDTSTQHYTDSLFAAAPPNSLILAAWHWATPLWYAHHVQGLRPDVEIRYVYPRTDSLANDWVNEIAANLPARPVIVTSFYPQEFNATPYRFLPLASAWQVLDSPLTTLPAHFSGAQSFGDLEFLGFQSPITNPQLPITILAAWSTAQPRDLNFFIHLVGPDGLLYAQADVSHPASRYAPGEILLDRYTLTPRPDAPPGDYALVAGAYLPDGTRVAETRLLTLALPPRPTAPITLHPLNRNFSGATLIGYDLDHSIQDSPRLYLHWQLAAQPVALTVLDSPLTLPSGPGYLTTAHDLAPDQPITISDFRLPTSDLYSLYLPLGSSILLTSAQLAARVAPRGQPYTVDLQFLATQPIVADYAVSVALVGPGLKLQSDATPVGGAIPTLKWIRGSRFHDWHTLLIPPDAPLGPAQIFVSVYDAFTFENLPLLDPRLARLGPAIPLGAVEIVP